MPFFLDKIKKIYNKDASLFLIHLKKNIHLPWSKLGDPMNFKTTTWKYSTSIVHELGLRMHAIFKWVNVLWSVSKGALVRINTHTRLAVTNVH